MVHIRSLFNRNLSKWNTSSVTDMQWMFYEADSFNGDVSKWDTSKVTTMIGMFRKTKFNGDVSKWDTSKVSKWDTGHGVGMYESKCYISRKIKSTFSFLK